MNINWKLRGKHFVNNNNIVYITETESKYLNFHLHSKQ